MPASTAAILPSLMAISSILPDQPGGRIDYLTTGNQGVVDLVILFR